MVRFPLGPGIVEAHILIAGLGECSKAHQLVLPDCASGKARHTQLVLPGPMRGRRGKVALQNGVTEFQFKSTKVNFANFKGPGQPAGGETREQIKRAVPPPWRIGTRPQPGGGRKARRRGYRCSGCYVSVKVSLFPVRSEPSLRFYCSPEGPGGQAKKLGEAENFPFLQSRKSCTFEKPFHYPTLGKTSFLNPCRLPGPSRQLCCLPNPLPPYGERHKQIAGRYVGGKADRHTPQDGPSMGRAPLEEV